MCLSIRGATISASDEKISRSFEYINHTYGFHQCIQVRRLSWSRTGGPRSPPAHGSSGGNDARAGCSGGSHNGGCAS